MNIACTESLLLVAIKTNSYEELKRNFGQFGKNKGGVAIKTNSYEELKQNPVISYSGNLYG